MKLDIEREEIHRYDVEKALKNNFGDNYTAKQALDYIFGDNHFYTGAYYVLGDHKTGTTILNRINMFWVIPILLILAPFNFILTGHIQFDRRNWFGKFMFKLVCANE